MIKIRELCSVLLIITLLVSLSGCRGKEINGAESKEKAIISLDDRDFIELIKKDKQYTDMAGKIFNEYITSDHFEIYYDNTDTNNKIYADSCIKELENNYQRILDFLKFEEKAMPAVKIFLFENMDSLKQSLTYELNGSIMGKINGFALYSNVFYINRECADFLSCSLNMFVHNVTMNMTFIDMIPGWLFQGTASYLSQKSDYYAWSYRSMSLNGFPPLDEFGSDPNNVYMYGYSMVEYIAKTYGDDKISELIRGYGDFYKILNITEDEFREGYKKFIKTKMKKSH